MKLFGIYIDHAAPNFGTVSPPKIKEEDVAEIVKIQKDNLSPKELPSDVQ
jgi:hypothetical protein